MKATIILVALFEVTITFTSGAPLGSQISDRLPLEAPQTEENVPWIPLPVPLDKEELSLPEVPKVLLPVRVPSDVNSGETLDIESMPDAPFTDYPNIFVPDESSEVDGAPIKVNWDDLFEPQMELPNDVMINKEKPWKFEALERAETSKKRLGKLMEMLSKRIQDKSDQSPEADFWWLRQSKENAKPDDNDFINPWGIYETRFSTGNNGAPLPGEVFDNQGVYQGWIDGLSEFSDTNEKNSRQIFRSDLMWPNYGELTTK